MRGYIKQIVSTDLDRQHNFNNIREYLQKYILFLLYAKKYLRGLIFTGGTALRILHGLKRFSEDLDFSLDKKTQRYDFEELLKTLKNELQQSGYAVDISWSGKKTVHKAFIRFAEILHETGLSPLRDEKLSIKLEIDTNPPEGGTTEVTLHNSIFMFHVLHYDIASMFTGKLNALLARKYTKGRDYYDLIWYLSKFKTIQPNFILLNNGLQQAQKNFKVIDEKNWRDVLAEKVETADMAAIVKDVEPLLENHSEIDLFKKDIIVGLIQKN